MRFLLVTFCFALLLMGCGGSSSSSSSPSYSTPYVETARVGYTKIFSHTHLRLLNGGMSQAAAQKTIDMVPRKRKVEYFAFFPSVPSDIEEAVKNSKSWVDAERVLKSYEGQKILARRMMNGRVMWETDSKPNP